jgi:hypothetical protein
VADPKTWCPQCGPGVGIDEDGCCTSCGATATGEGAEQALRLKAKLDSAYEAVYERRELREALTECQANLEAAEAKLAEAERKLSEAGPLFCLYCGKEDPPDTPAQVLADHIRVCEKHPLARALAREKALREAREDYAAMLRTLGNKLREKHDWRDRIVSFRAVPAQEGDRQDEHKKHPAGGDYCVFCLSQWPCEEALAQEQR